jgi:outer membrane protein TolC
MFRSHAVRKVTFVLTLLLPAAARAANDAPIPPAVALTGKAGGLTADAVARRATATSLAVEVKKHDVEAAEAQMNKTLADFFPRLALNASYQRLSPVTNSPLGNVVFAPGGAGGPIQPGQPLVAVPLTIKTPDNATALSATLSVPLSDYVFRIVQAHEGSTAQRAASERALRAEQRKASYDARSLYYDWVRVELEHAVATQNLELGRENLARIRSLAAADSASEADIARVEATVAASDLVVAQSQNLAALQRERLAIAMHDTGASDYQIGDDFRVTSGAADTYETPSLVRLAVRQRPEVDALALEASAYGKQAEVARSQAIPRLDAFAQGTTANPNQRYFPPEQTFHSTWAVGVQLTYAPNDTATGLSSAAQARAKAAGVDAERRALLDAIHIEVAEAVLAHRNAVVGIETSSRRVAAAETSYRARRERFVAEKATTVELTEAQTELFNARLEAVEAQVAIRRAKARIAYVTGGDL